MFKKMLASFVVFVITAFTLVACSGTSSGTPDTSSNTSTSGTQVHMAGMNFVQTAVTLQKGESITLVADDSMPHIIANGTWQNGTAQATKEAGAPEVNNVQIQGRNSSQTIGPFKASGTFHFY
jgi:hypothetical protein